MNKLENHTLFSGSSFMRETGVIDALDWNNKPTGKKVNIATLLSAPLRSEAMGQLIYLTEAYMHFYGKHRANSAAAIHDGWAIARILQWDRKKLVNFNIANSDNTVMFHELDDQSIKTLLETDDKTNRNITIRFKETINGFDFNFSFRGDQLKMFVDYDKLTEKDKLADEPFANFIATNKEAIKILADAISDILKPSRFEKCKVKQLKEKAKSSVKQLT